MTSGDAPLRFAVGVPLNTAPPNPELLTVDAIARLAVAAEDAGFSAIWLTEHPAPSEEWRTSGGHDAIDPFVGLTVAATVTTRLRLLTNLTVVPYRNPFLLAKTVASLDALSGGRLTLGAGTGYLEAEYDAIGVDFAERNDRFDESFEVMRKAWTGEPVDHDGRHFRAAGIRSVPTPVQQPHPPLWLGGNSRLTRRRVAAWGQGWMPMPNPRTLGNRRRSAHLEDLPDLRTMLGHLEEEMEKAGRTDSVDVMCSPFAGGVPGTSRFDGATYVEALHELVAEGVTWTTVGVAAKSLDHALDSYARFGAEVIAPMQAATGKQDTP
ncbi:MAG: LLM class F420-dependent oxidoreductase [Acidimicrobiales bacterium]|nr:LLM class F420-dependent oxidoreductase [Acidimicrobiales bacterium]